MMAPETAVRVLVVPVFKRYWLWHAWKIAAPVSTTPQKPWQQGKDLQEKAQLFLAGIQRWGSKQGEQQWHKIATAPEGTFNHKLFRYVQQQAAVCEMVVLAAPHIKQKSIDRTAILAKKPHVCPPASTGTRGPVGMYQQMPAGFPPESGPLLKLRFTPASSPHSAV